MPLPLPPALRKLIDYDDHSKIVWRFIELEKKINPPQFLERLTLASNLFVQPIGHILFWGCYLFLPAMFVYFGGKVEMTTLSILMYAISTIQVVYSTFTNWSDIVEHYNLGTILYTWKILTHGMGLPLIKIHSDEPSHQYFKYAAAISLLQNLG
jgi:hypothetical protein